MPADLDWIIGPGYRAGTFWGVLNVSLRASGIQLGLDLTCFVIRHPSSVICHRPVKGVIFFLVTNRQTSPLTGGPTEVIIFPDKQTVFVTDGGSN